jgi:NhaP-type Na+/H+ or K+/H+ antiporter
MGYTLVSGRAKQFYVSPPLIFTIVGALLGLARFGVPAGNVAIKLLAESTLALILFHDAAHAHPRELLGDWKLLARMLLVALPIAIIAGFFTARWLFPELSVAFALFIASALAPTDAGLGAPTILNPVVPTRVRRLLNGESGLNDGLGTPVVLFAITLAMNEGTTISVGSAFVHAASEIAIGAVFGIVLGFAFGWLLRRAEDHDWADPTVAQIGVVVIPLLGFFGAELLHGNGFIAAFIAGTAYAGSAGEQLDHDIKLAEEMNTLMGFAVWALFGMLFVSHLSDYVTWQCIVFGLLALTALRMLPMWFSLARSGLREPTKWFLAWFGPRGLASVVFALIAYEELGEHLPRVVWGVMGVTVLMCVFAHGVSAPPLSERYGAWANREKPQMELAG